ncbi:DUF1508 domain-containing protein [Halodesulfovibrio spirochaetisodalis]|uniref:DUF1508 domain-containing protein n=1 Tax=Halodesulfovibrio spirochaetisodalis TaxID=1560234 RepID=UPI0008297762
MTEKWDFYKDYAQQWRWRRKEANGKTVGASPKGYETRQECLEHARRHGFSD